MDTIKLLYSPEDLPRLEKKIKRERAWVWCLSGLTLGLCVLFCCLTTTANAERMETATVICSCLGGWIVIYRRRFGMQAARHELTHAAYLLEEPGSLLRGRLSITGERLRIKNSISLRILLLENEEGRQRLKVNETRVKALQPWNGKDVTLRMVGGYVAGIGGQDADA